MLAKLRKFDQRTRAGILAGLTQELLPSPGFAEVKVPPNVPSELYATLLGDIRRQLDIPPGDPSPDAMRRMLSFLNTQLREAILDTSQIKKIKERVGDKGILRPDLYTINFSDSFRDLSETMGVQRQRAKRIVLNSRVVEHLLPEMFGQEDGQGKSLFVETTTDPDPHSLLILADRAKDVLTIHQGWLIFHSDVDVSNTKTPVDLLRAFVAQYGVEIMVAGRPEGKFLLYRSFDHIRPNTQFELLRPHTPPSTPLDSNFSFRHSTVDAKIEVALAFSIDVLKYAADLRKHGIKVTRAT